MNAVSRLSFLALTVQLVACSAAPNPQQANWYARRDAQPLDFSVSASDLPAAWARAQECVASISPGEVFPIQVATEAVIQTGRNSEFANAGIWMTVARTPNPDGSATLHFSAGSMNPMQSGRVERLARACAYFTASGERYPG